MDVKGRFNFAVTAVQACGRRSNRGEAISVTGISDSGEIVDLWCQFKRNDSGIEFGELRNLGEFGKAHYNSLEPIRKAFLKLKTEIQKKD